MNKFFVIVGPGGVGKDTLAKEVMKELPNVFPLVSCTTRKPRQEDIPGKTYNFFTNEEFEEMIKNNEFLEYDHHFNAYFGSRKKDLEEILKKGNAISDIDIVGAENLKKQRNDIVTVFIKAKSKEVLIDRLKSRGMNEEKIKMKLARFDEEMKYEIKADYIIVNDDLKTAVNELKEIIKKETS
jgi:guanylate kinase